MAFARNGVNSYRLRDKTSDVYRVITYKRSEATLTNFSASSVIQFRLSEDRVDEYFCRSKSILTRNVGAIENYVRDFRRANNNVLVSDYFAKDFQFGS